MKKNTKILIGVIALVVIVCIGVCIYVNSSPAKYTKAQKAMNNNEYQSAAEIFEKIPDYKDSKELFNKCAYEYAKSLLEKSQYEEALGYFDKISDYENVPDLITQCNHQIDVKNDTEPPVLSGIEDTINVKAGTEFNIKDYLTEKMSITDNVSSNITDFSVSCENKLFNQGSGDIDTEAAETLDVIVTAKDEAENEGQLNIKVNIKPIHVTRKKPNPTIYDGKYGTIKIKEFNHGYIDGANEYQILFEIKNKTEDPMIVCLSSETSINDYQVGSYYTVSYIASGKSGIMESNIYENDISKDIGDYNQIDSKVCLSKSKDSDSYYVIPIIFDANAATEKNNSGGNVEYEYIYE